VEHRLFLSFCRVGREFPMIPHITCRASYLNLASCWFRWALSSLRRDEVGCARGRGLVVLLLPYISAPKYCRSGIPSIQAAYLAFCGWCSWCRPLRLLRGCFRLDRWWTRSLPWILASGHGRLDYGHRVLFLDLDLNIISHGHRGWSLELPLYIYKIELVNYNLIIEERGQTKVQ